MPTESIPSYQEQWNEEQSKGFLWLWEQVKAHPVIAVVIFGVIVFVILKFIIPGIIRYCQKQGIKNPSEVPASEHLTDSVRKDEIKKKRISILPAPAVDPKYCHMTLHERLVELAESIEQADPSHRTRCCVVCRDEKLVENYARMFYQRIENAAVLDKHGWVYYKKPKDDTLELCIEHCFFESLRMYNEILLPEKRFIRQVDFFDQPNVHTLLVISKTSSTNKQDDALLQIASLAGLSIVLFSAKPVPGYHTIEIPQEGGDCV